VETVVGGHTVAVLNDLLLLSRLVSLPAGSVFDHTHAPLVRRLSRRRPNTSSGQCLTTSAYSTALRLLQLLQLHVHTSIALHKQGTAVPLAYLQSRNDCRVRPELGALPLKRVWRHPGGIFWSGTIRHCCHWLDGRPSIGTCVAASHRSVCCMRDNQRQPQ
jgi:hypothetical protein